MNLGDLNFKIIFALVKEMVGSGIDQFNQSPTRDTDQTHGLTEYHCHRFDRLAENHTIAGPVGQKIKYGRWGKVGAGSLELECTEIVESECPESRVEDRGIIRTGPFPGILPWGCFAVGSINQG